MRNDVVNLKTKVETYNEEIQIEWWNLCFKSVSRLDRCCWLLIRSSCFSPIMALNTYEVSAIGARSTVCITALSTFESQRLNHYSSSVIIVQGPLNGLTVWFVYCQ